VRAAPAHHGERGQAALELALCLPILALLLLALVQVGLVVRDQVAVVHAAREGARAAAVTGAGPSDAVAAAHGAVRLDAGRLAVDAARGDVVRVTVRYRAPTDVPLVGRLIGDVSLRATAVMRAEP
jgi:Flp pilus assembly protein TadG